MEKKRQKKWKAIKRKLGVHTVLRPLNVLTYELKRIKCKFLPGHGPDCPASLSPLQS